MHQLDQVRREQGILGGVIQFERMALQDLRLGEPGPDEFLDEDTLRQCSGYSTGPSGGMGEDLRR